MSDDARRRAAPLAAVTSAVLIAVKVALALLTGSAAVLAEATHAAAELLRTIVAAFAARDEERPGGVPSAAGRLEGGIVVAAGVVAAFASLRSLDGERRPARWSASPACSPARCWPALVAARVSAVAKETRSAALQADARSLRSSQTTAVLAAAALALVLLLHTELPDTVGGLRDQRRRGARRASSSCRPRCPGASGWARASWRRSRRRSPAGRRRWSATAGSSARTAAGVRRIDIDVMLQAGVDGRRMAADRGGAAGRRSGAASPGAGSSCTYVNLSDPRGKQAFGIAHRGQ